MPVPASASFATGTMRGVDADRGDAGDRRVGRVRPDALGAQSARTLPVGVLPLERGQVHHPDGELERPDLGCLLDGPLLERVDALVDAHLVHAADAVEQRAGRPRPADPGVDERGGLLLRGGARGARAGLGSASADPGHELAHGCIVPRRAAPAGRPGLTVRRSDM